MTFPVLTAALDLLQGVASAVPAERFDDPTPCTEWTVAQLLLHAAGDQHAWASAVAASPAVRTPLPPVPTLTAEPAAVACAMDAAVHSWDVATATGQGSPLTSALAARMMAAARATVEPLRGFAYAPALPAQPGDDSVDTLLRYLGRDPNWSA